MGCVPMAVWDCDTAWWLQAQKESHIPDTALNELATHILHGVLTGATYKELVWCLRNAMVTTNWKQQSILGWREGPCASRNPRRILLPSLTIWLVVPSSDYPSTWLVKNLPVHIRARNKSSCFWEATKYGTRPSGRPWVTGRMSWVSCSWMLAAIQQGREHRQRSTPIAGSCYLAMPSEDTKALMFAVVICKVWKLVIVLQRFVVTSHKSPVNPIINPTPMSSHKYMKTCWEFSSFDGSIKSPYLNYSRSHATFPQTTCIQKNEFDNFGCLLSKILKPQSSKIWQDSNGTTIPKKIIQFWEVRLWPLLIWHAKTLSSMLLFLACAMNVIVDTHQLHSWTVASWPGWGLPPYHCSTWPLLHHAPSASPRSLQTLLRRGWMTLKKGVQACIKRVTAWHQSSFASVSDTSWEWNSLLTCREASPGSLSCYWFPETGPCFSHWVYCWLNLLPAPFLAVERVVSITQPNVSSFSDIPHKAAHS